MKSYKPTTLQPSLNVKQVVKIRQDLKLEKFVVEAKYVKELKSSQKLNLMFHEIKLNIENVDVPRSSQKLQLGLQKYMKEEEEEWFNLKLNLKVQQKGNEMGIKPINKIYNEKFKQFVYYCWIQHSLVPNSTPP
jgi:hypothetical protein